MKKTILSLALITLFGASVVANPIVKETKEVKTSESQVTWKGYKVGGSHTGTISLKSGALEFDGEKLVGGSFVVDMTSINTTDLEGDYKGQLDGHLKSDDFFGTANYPTATLNFTKVKSSGKNSYEVQGDLTIKGTTEPVTFDVSVYGDKATATVKVDRTKYDVKYGSGIIGTAKDKLIYDEFDLVVDLQM
ncbi:YceI family protein [Flagellimonas lutimaris]|jgi:polyisoprenoid-binding protein YceI|uniref:YceI family protein n=1 Tax=Flagellimonas TaxID=444459 RepID=UPI000B683DD8|nr:MAG: YceI family protein [Muricauda sp. TMED12]|tara:strand:+ start:45 stop:617 length:573 start_codon:yes stop_codon:yes gene_type:complete